MILNKRTLGVAASALALSLAACLGACSPKPAGEPVGSDGGEAPDPQAEFVWSEGSDCGACHMQETASQGDASNAFAAAHAVVGCLECHDAALLAEPHEGAVPEKAAKAVMLDHALMEERCSSCHDGAELIEATAECVVLTDEEGTVVNPHALPASESHDTVSCSNCHRMHQGSTAEENAFSHCLSCHHEEVFTCHTCHD